VLIEVFSQADARALAASLPLAPYADVTVRRSDLPAAARLLTRAPASTP